MICHCNLFCILFFLCFSRKGGGGGGGEYKKKTIIFKDESVRFDAVFLKREGSFFHLMLQSNNKGGGRGPTEIRGKNFFFL